MSYWDDFLKEEPEESLQVQKKKLNVFLPGEKIEKQIEKKSQKKEAALVDSIEIKDFLSDLATSSEFERLIYKAIFGKVIRGSTEETEKKLEEGIRDFRNFIKNK